MAKYKAVLIDLDGTLVDSNDAHAEAWREALHRGGYEVPYKKVRELIGMGSDNFLPAAVKVEKESAEGKRLSRSWEEIFNEKYLQNLKPFPGARDLIKRFHDSGLKVVVATSAKEDMMKQLLRIAQIEQFITERTSADEAKNSKPDPDIVQAALDKAGAAPEEAVMLGDTPYDIESAHKAGVATIGLRCGGWDDQDLSGAIAVYQDPADFLANYNRSPLTEVGEVRTAK